MPIRPRLAAPGRRARPDSLRPGPARRGPGPPPPAPGPPLPPPRRPQPPARPGSAPLSRPPLSFPPGRGAAWRSPGSGRPSEPRSGATGRPRPDPRPRRARLRTCPTARPLEHRAPLGPLRAPGPQHNPGSSRARRPGTAPGTPRTPGPRRSSGTSARPGTPARSHSPGARPSGRRAAVRGPRPRGSPSYRRRSPAPKGPPGPAGTYGHAPKGSRHPASGAPRCGGTSVPSRGLPAPLRGRLPGRSPAPRRPGRMHAALAGPLLAALLATARARPQPPDGGQCRPPGSVSERPPGHSPGRPATPAPRGRWFGGPAFRTHFGPPVPPLRSGQCLGRPALASASRAPAPCGEPSWGAPSPAPSPPADALGLSSDFRSCLDLSSLCPFGLPSYFDPSLPSGSSLPTSDTVSAVPCLSLLCAFLSFTHAQTPRKLPSFS